MKFRIAIVCSVVWFFVVLSGATDYDEINWNEVISGGVLPLVIAWGIWWILKARKATDDKKQ